MDSSIVGQATEPVRHDVDARWLMAYAAGLGDANPVYFDTAKGAISAHPLFSVCLEWPAVLETRLLPGLKSLSRDEGMRGVHASHDVHLLRPITTGTRLRTCATIVEVRETRAGAAQMTRLDTVDERGELLVRTYQLGISRGVGVSGGDRSVEKVPPTPEVPVSVERRLEPLIDVPTGAAHVYTECARIWNPIHTDRAVARAAGLPDIILHGTATMALAVSQLTRAFLGGDPTRVRRVGGRFAGIVLMPNALELRVRVGEGTSAGTIGYCVYDSSGRRVIDNGYLCHD